jgi:predicted ATP-grasp superfamily ATP-dependent carboligase
LAADKPAVFAEIARVLRPGGRIGITDIVAEDTLTPEERAARGSYAGCIAGALSMAEFRAGLAAVGLKDVSITPTHAVADGMVSAIVQATKPTDARPVVDLTAARALPVAEGGCCGGSGCC